MAEKMIDPWFKQPVATPRSLTNKNPDRYEKEHAVPYSGAESLGNMAVRFNRALRDKRTARPGVGRWVEYILPDLRRVYVEANLKKMIIGTMNDSTITARVVIKPGGMEYTNNMQSLIFMRMVEVSGDMLDVVRTASKVGLYVPDPETRGTNSLPEKIAMSLVKEARKKYESPSAEDKERRKRRSTVGALAGGTIGAMNQLANTAANPLITYSPGARAVAAGAGFIGGATTGAGLGHLSAVKKEEDTRRRREKKASLVKEARGILGEVRTKDTIAPVLAGLGIAGGIHAAGRAVGASRARSGDGMRGVSTRTYVGEAILPGYASGKRKGYEKEKELQKKEGKKK